MSVLFSLMIGYGRSLDQPPQTSQTTVPLLAPAGCEQLAKRMIPNPTKTGKDFREFVETLPNGSTLIHRVWCASNQGTGD